MPRFQFSLRALLGAAVFVAVACSSLLYASETIASLVFTATVLVLLAAVVAAVCRRGAARAFWVGFAIFGWGYLWLAIWPEPAPSMVMPARGPEGFQEYRGLVTTKLMVFAYEALLPWMRTPPPPQPSGPYGTPAPVWYSPGMYDDDPFGDPSAPRPEGPGYPAYAPIPAPYPPATRPPASSYPSYPAFMRVGHSLWAWLFALFGAVLARHIYRTREKKPQTPTQSAAS
jgi:hypothetical protein